LTPNSGMMHSIESAPSKQAILWGGQQV
jgi:hypothetical protein